MLVPKLRLILNGETKKLKLFNQKNLKFKKKLQRKVVKRIKIETKSKKKNKKFSTFHTVFKINSSH